MIKTTRCFASFEEMCWPLANEAVGDIGWRLRYGYELTESERLVAASVISAYIQMINDPAEKRNKVIKVLHEASK